MIRRIKENLNMRAKMARLKKALGPDELFLRSARNRFLSSFAPQPQPRQFRRHALRLGTAMVAVFVFIVGSGGLAALADFKDVSASNPLYNLKRFSEQTRLVLTSEEKKPVAHVKLAERRLKEIKEQVAELKVVNTRNSDKVKNTAPVSAKVRTLSETIAPVASASATQLPILKKLEEDFRQEVKNVVEDDDKEETGEHREHKVRLCKTLDEAVKNKLVESRRGEMLEARCKKVESGVVF